MDTFPLHRAAEEGDLDRIKQLIEGGMSGGDSRDEDWGSTLLHWAAYWGQYEVSKLLIDREWDLNAAMWSGTTPLMTAVERGHNDVAVLLIRAGADINQRNGRNEETSLHLAAYYGRTLVVQVLLEQEGLDLNPQDDDGWTPLYWACLYGHQDILKLLLEGGADPNIKNNDSETALSMRIKRGNTSPDEIGLLVHHGAFFEEFDFAGISQNPILKEKVLKDAKLCTQSVINKFHRQSLPTLYRNPYFEKKLPNLDTFKLNAQQIDEVENLVKCDIIRNAFCNVVKVRPMALSALCVLSLVAALPRQAEPIYLSSFYL